MPKGKQDGVTQLLCLFEFEKDIKVTLLVALNNVFI